MSDKTVTAKWFGLNGKIPAVLQGMLFALVMIGICVLVLPWAAKFLSWYYPWVKNV